MKVRCLHNTGEAIMSYNRRPYGVSSQTQYQIEVGKEYLVMGMFMQRGHLLYILDEKEVVYACPSQLFKVIEQTVPSNWHFKALSKADENYFNQEAVWGYYELVFEPSHYDQLLAIDDQAHWIYFKRKTETEENLSQ